MRMADSTIPPSSPKQKMLDMASTSPDNDNFLGSGLTFSEFLVYNMIQRWENSLPTLVAQGDEKDRRLRLIQDLSVAINKIEQVSVWNTSCMVRALEAIIYGDWDDLREVERELTYEDPELREQFQELHAPVLEIVRRAYQEAILRPSRDTPLKIIPGGEDED